MRIDSPARSRGLTLVELLVGVVVGMIGVLVIMQVAATFEGDKRTTVGTAESMDEGSIGLYHIRREIQGAGYGLADRDLIGCTVRAHSADPNAPLAAMDFSFRLLPVFITQGALGAPDSIQVIYSNFPMASTATRLSLKFAGDEATNIRVANRYGFALGNAFILAEPGSGKDCSMYEVTGLPALAGETDQIVHKLEIYNKLVGGQNVLTKSRYNKGGGLGIEYNVDSKVLNIGATPVVNTFMVCRPGDPLPCQPDLNNQLVFVDGLRNAVTPLFDNVVTFKVQYGIDARPAPAPPAVLADTQVPAQDYIVGTGGFSSVMVDADNDGTVGDADDWLRVGAVRVVIVVRNKYPERPDAGGNCVTTTVLPSWTWGAIPAGTLPADWGCYRYKTFETVIPLRNMFWKTPQE